MGSLRSKNWSGYWYHVNTRFYL